MMVDEKENTAINLNQFVTVKLTTIGKEQLEKFHKRYNPYFDINTWVGEDDSYRTQMHTLMLVFGGEYYPTFEQPFKDCIIEIK